MTDGSQPQGRLRDRRVRIGLAVVVAVGVIALVALIWYIFFRPAGPPPVGPEAPLIPDGASVEQHLVYALNLLPI